MLMLLLMTAAQSVSMKILAKNQQKKSDDDSPANTHRHACLRRRSHHRGHHLRITLIPVIIIKSFRSLFAFPLSSICSSTPFHTRFVCTLAGALLHRRLPVTVRGSETADGEREWLCNRETGIGDRGRRARKELQTNRQRLCLQKQKQQLLVRRCKDAPDYPSCSYGDMS